MHLYSYIHLLIITRFMFMIIMHLFLHMNSGSHLSTKKTRHDGVHVYQNMRTSVGVLVHFPMHTQANEHASLLR